MSMTDGGEKKGSGGGVSVAGEINEIIYKSIAAFNVRVDSLRTTAITTCK